MRKRTLLTKTTYWEEMSSYLRPKVRGASIFFTVRLANRRSDLLVREITMLRDAVRKTRKERPFEINAWVVLPDHMHCVWTLPSSDHDFSTRWRLIKTRFSRNLPKAHLRQSHVARGERGVWQRRFWEHHIRNQADMRDHIAYCWQNPQKHGLVNDPYDWPYSTIHRDG